MPNTKPIGVAYEDQQLDGAIIGTSGGTAGFFGTTPVSKAAALTAALTTITATAPGTPDYAIANLTAYLTVWFCFIRRRSNCVESNCKLANTCRRVRISFTSVRLACLIK